MATKELITYISICLFLSVVATNGQGYSYTTNTIVNDIYTLLGYVPESAPERWAAEGDAIHSALKYIDTLEPSVFAEDGGIEFIVGNTGGNTSTYICGLTKRVGDSTIADNQIPSAIIIVYTLNYVNRYGAAEYVNFKNEIDKLIAAAESRKATKKVEIVVRNFRPVSKDIFEISKEFGCQDVDFTKMNQNHADFQKTGIEELHSAVKVTGDEIINTVQFKELLSNINIKKIVDGVAGSGTEKITMENQLLLAIPTRQINIMSEAIVYHTRLELRRMRDRNVIVISNDNPSGMDENGSWTTNAFRADYILSCVWHKKLVNSGHLVGKPKAIVLDIIFKGKRLVAELLAMISTAAKRDIILEGDVETAIQVKTGVITFKANDLVRSRMVVVPD